MTEKKFVSLFSGAGGLDYGFIQDGWTPILMADFWGPSVSTLRVNHPDVPIFQWDISDLTEKDLEKSLNDVGVSKNIDVVIGGPPCQAFSRLNQNQLFGDGRETEFNINDPRRSLFMDFLRVVNYLQPKAVVMENVYDIATRKLGGKGPDKNVLIVDIIVKEFLDVGYNIEYAVLKASNYNTPQARRRMIFIATRKDLNKEPSLPLPVKLSTSVKDQFHKIARNDPNQELKKHSKKWVEKVKHIPPGGYYKHLPTKMKVLKKVTKQSMLSYDGQDRNFCFEKGKNLVEFRTILEKGNGIVAVEMNGKRYSVTKFKQFIRNFIIYRIMPRMGTYLRRINWNVSHTVTRNPLIHPDKDRELSVREKAAIQTFPTDYKFCGSNQEQHILIGNAVPCNMAYEIAKHIRKIIE